MKFLPHKKIWIWSFISFDGHNITHRLKVCCNDFSDILALRLLRDLIWLINCVNHILMILQKQILMKFLPHKKIWIWSFISFDGHNITHRLKVCCNDFSDILALRLLRDLIWLIACVNHILMILAKGQIIIILSANNTCGAWDRPSVMGPHLSLKPSVMYWTPGFPHGGGPQRFLILWPVCYDGSVPFASYFDVLCPQSLLVPSDYSNWVKQVSACAI